jgi:molybdate transport system substrate-binding protein
MQVAVDAGRVVSGTARTFVRNRLVVIYPKDNPAGIITLQDLAKPGLKLILAAATVPVGGYSLDFLKKASATPEFGEAYSQTVMSNVVTFEDNVRAVLSKIALGEGDAGIVYTTDIVGGDADHVAQLAIPDDLNTIASYPIATISDSANPYLAKAYMDYVLDAGGQTTLVKFGFIPTIGTVTGEKPVAASLQVTGLISAPIAFAAVDLMALPQVTITATDKNASPASYTGIALATLLEKVGISPDAKTLTFVGGDGYSVDVPLSDAMADKDAMIAVDENGAARSIFPTMPPKNWVKGLVEIQVK